MFRRPSTTCCTSLPSQRLPPSCLFSRRPHSLAIDDPYHYIDINSLIDQSGGDGNQSVSNRGYEGLDPAVVQALRERARGRQDYVRLGAVDEVAEADGTVGDIEMSEFGTRNDSQNAVCLPPSETYRIVVIITLPHPAPSHLSSLLHPPFPLLFSFSWYCPKGGDA